MLGLVCAARFIHKSANGLGDIVLLNVSLHVQLFEFGGQNNGFLA